MAGSARRIRKFVHSSEQVAFRELMTSARLKAGLTQSELAARLGKPQSFVAKYEGGERRIDVLEFLTIAQALEADPRKLFAVLVRHVAES